MAISTGAALALTALAGAGVQAYNTNRTLRRQDQQAAAGIREQGRIQRQADARVAEEVASLEASNNAKDRADRLASYLGDLARKRQVTEAGLTPAIGSAAFQAGSEAAKGDVANYGAETAELLSGIDAPSLQRQREGFGYGRLASDIGLLGRESRGEQFINELRLRAIQRNPWLDAAGSILTGIGSGGAGGLAGLFSGAQPNPNTKPNPGGKTNFGGG